MLGEMTMKRTRGLTLIELLVVIAVVGTIAALAAPSFKDMILMQRLRGINAELVTDLQFARSEAVARRDFVRIFFQSDLNSTCYTIYTSPTNSPRCDCRAGPGAACSGARVEIKTVKVARSSGVTVAPPSAQAAITQALAFDWRTGGIYLIPTDADPEPMNAFIVDSYVDDARKLRTRLNAAGRPQVCTPSGSTLSETACP